MRTSAQSRPPTRTRYHELCACVGKHMRRSHVLQAPAEFQPALNSASEEPVLQIEAFYMLGESAVAEAGQHVVRLAVLVHSLNLMDGTHYYNEQDKHKIVFTARLVDAQHEPIVALHALEGLALCHNLVYTSRQEVAREDCPPALALVTTRDVWK